MQGDREELSSSRDERAVGISEVNDISPTAPQKDYMTMSINEQIEAAWMNLLSSRPEGHWKRDSFEAGYREALLDLYGEIEPSECVHGESYWVLTEEDGWKFSRRSFGKFVDEFDDVYGDEDVTMVICDHIVAPGELFGEEVGK